MGEQKRRLDRMLPADREALRLTNELANKGMLLAGGFAAYLTINGIPVADPRVPLLNDMFMTGCEHLMSSMMATLDPGREPTESDYKRMDAIQAELDVWRKRKMEAYAASMPTKGSA